MSSRIKYRDNGDGTMTSKGTLISETTGAAYVVYVDTTLLSYKIKNVERNNFIKEGKVGNYNYMLRKIKNELESLGVSFKLEMRKERPDMVKRNKNNNLES